MRNAFAEAVTEIADENQELIMLAGDIGNRLFDQRKVCVDVYSEFF